MNLTRCTLIAILLLAAGFRFYGLDWGIASLKDFRKDGNPVSFADGGFHPDSLTLESATASLARSIYPTIEMDGRTILFVDYGTVFVYLSWMSTHIAGGLFGFEPFNSESAHDANTTRLVGRTLSAVAGLIAVWLTYLLGASIAGPLTGLLAAFLLAVMPMAVQAAHMATVDSLLSVGAAWICLRALRIVHHPLDARWTGIPVGLTVATKLNGVFLSISVALAHLLYHLNKTPGGGWGRKLWSAVSDRRIWASAGWAIGIFLILTPATVLRFRDYFLTESSQNAFYLLFTGIAGQYRHRGWLYLENIPTYLYHFTHVFPASLGWPCLIAIGLACIYACYKRRPEDLVLAGTALIYFLIIARYPDKPIRYFVAIGPVLACLTARLFTDGLGHPVKTIRRLAAVGTAVVCTYTTLYAAAFTSLYGTSDSRVQAVSWIQENVPKGASILLERGHNSLTEILSSKRYREISMDIEQEMIEALKPAFVENGDYLAYLESEYLSHTDIVLISDDRIPISKVRPAARQYYEALFNGRLGFEQLATFRMTPQIFGFLFDDSDADLNWRRYDHPVVHIFRRSGVPALYTERPDLQIYRLRTWADCRQILQKTVKYREFQVFKRCLPEKFKASVSQSVLLRLFAKFMVRPDFLDQINNQGRFMEENGTWRLKIRAQ